MTTSFSIILIGLLFMIIMEVISKINWNDTDSWEPEDGREDPDFDLEDYMRSLDQEEADIMDIEF